MQGGYDSQGALGVRARGTGGSYLARIGIDGPDVELAVRSLQDDLLHVDADLLHAFAIGFQIDELQELLDVPEKFLGDALCCAVSG